MLLNHSNNSADVITQTNEKHITSSRTLLIKSTIDKFMNNKIA